MGVSPFLPVLRENSAVSLHLALFLTFVGQNGAGCQAGQAVFSPLGRLLGALKKVKHRYASQLRSMLGMPGFGVESGLMSGR